MRIVVLALLVAGTVNADIQTSTSVPASARKSGGPVVSVPTRGLDSVPHSKSSATSTHVTPSTLRAPVEVKRKPPIVVSKSQPTTPGYYPWRMNIPATVFWVGESATRNNPVPNDKSSWEHPWQESFGGYDDPNPTRRLKHRPLSFVPKQNPFYVALPYNDVTRGSHKPEASRVIPWFRRDYERPGKSVCKGKWVQIVYNNRYCFAQWEDCGPFTTEDWQYVFGDSPPQNKRNSGAGIDISPAVRDYLGIKGGLAQVHWRFVDFHRVKIGPWSKYGDNNPFLHPELVPGVQSKKVHVDQLKKQRDEMLKKLQQDPQRLRRELQG